MPEDSTQQHDRLLTLGDFDYPFPERLVAQAPRESREQARLLVRHADGRVRHAHVPDLTLELPAGTLLILNDTRVFPSRVTGTLETGGRIELFLLRESPGGTWTALARPMKKLSPGRTVQLAEGLSAEIVARHEDTVEVRFGLGGEALAQWLDRNGFVPLPPYIKRPDADRAAVSADRERYQTVYAKERGSVAAPTAGLHFTDDLLARLGAAGVRIATLSLHVGAGTFLPVKTDDVALHRMHAEMYRVPAETVTALLQARAEGRPVVAVGTTTFRSLEDLYRRAGREPGRMPDLADAWHSTELFIHPRTAQDRFVPWVIDGLVTNFHQPCSTLFMLVSALLGLEEAQATYRTAIEQEYRLYSYGDTSLFWLSRASSSRGS